MKFMIAAFMIFAFIKSFIDTSMMYSDSKR
jgi:hypothetical protein